MFHVKVISSKAKKSRPKESRPVDPKTSINFLNIQNLPKIKCQNLATICRTLHKMLVFLPVIRLMFLQECRKLSMIASLKVKQCFLFFT